MSTRAQKTRKNTAESREARGPETGPSLENEVHAPGSGGRPESDGAGPKLKAARKRKDAQPRGADFDEDEIR